MVSNKVHFHKFTNGSPSYEDVEASLSKLLKLSNLQSRIEKVNSIFIKPNMVTDNPTYIKNGANTDIKIIEAVIAYLNNFNISVKLGESETGTAYKGRNYLNAISHMGIDKLQNKYDFEIVNLTEDKWVDIKIPDPIGVKSITLPMTPLRSDLIINLPKLKTHKYATITCSLKNMFGIIPDPMRVTHHRHIHEILGDLNQVFGHKTISILDALVGMEGKGPLYGNPVNMDLISVSEENFVQDIFASILMGFDPRKIRHINILMDKYQFRVNDLIVKGNTEFKSCVSNFTPSKRNWFVELEKFITQHPALVNILYSDFFRSNITYYFRKPLAKLRGGSYTWYHSKGSNKDKNEMLDYHSDKDHRSAVKKIN